MAHWFDFLAPSPSTLHSSYSTPHLYILPLSAWLLANPTTLSFLWSAIEPPQWLTPNVFSRIWHTLHAALMMGFACSIEWHATDLINIHNAGRQAGASVQLKSAWTSPTRPELKSPNQTQSDRHRQMQTTTTAKISWITSIFYFYSYNIFFDLSILMIRRATKANRNNDKCSRLLNILQKCEGLQTKWNPYDFWQCLSFRNSFWIPEEDNIKYVYININI